MDTVVDVLVRVDLAREVRALVDLREVDLRVVNLRVVDLREVDRRVVVLGVALVLYLVVLVIVVFGVLVPRGVDSCGIVVFPFDSDVDVSNELVVVSDSV